MLGHNDRFFIERVAIIIRIIRVISKNLVPKAMVLGVFVNGCKWIGNNNIGCRQLSGRRRCGGCCFAFLQFGCIFDIEFESPPSSPRFSLASAPTAAPNIKRSIHNTILKRTPYLS